MTAVTAKTANMAMTIKSSMRVKPATFEILFIDVGISY